MEVLGTKMLNGDNTGEWISLLQDLDDGYWKGSTKVVLCDLKVSKSSVHG